ncbi:MAG: hypothetical protein IKE65_08970 [Clostridia bacterium]|nr:hypothetical protein [Clostridia bacterium]
MKITAFNPLIVTKDAAPLISLFEEIGFERKHTKTGISGNVTSVNMSYTTDDGKEFNIDISEAPVPQDIPTIRMSVSDFDEAYEMLEEKGFKNIQGERVTETGSSTATMMVSPSGFSISISKHIK